MFCLPSFYPHKQLQNSRAKSGFASDQPPPEPPESTLPPVSKVLAATAVVAQNPPPPPQRTAFTSLPENTIPFSRRARNPWRL